jgi:glycerophosphoryl diester phosphodiesterase
MAQLALLDAGSWKGAAFAGEALPSFANAAACCRAHGMLLNVEIKPCPGRDAETGRIVAQEAARLWAGAAVPPLLSSFSFEALQAAQQAEPDCPRLAGGGDSGRLAGQIAAAGLHCPAL